jgi:hypothetical protein
VKRELETGELGTGRGDSNAIATSDALPSQPLKKKRKKKKRELQTVPKVNEQGGKSAYTWFSVPKRAAKMATKLS